MSLRVAGEMIQLAMLRIRDGVPAPRAMATLAMDRAIGFVGQYSYIGRGVSFSS